MTSADFRFNRWLALLVLASFTVFAAAVVLLVGLGASPGTMTHSGGKPMGFNDPLDFEHYAIMVRNFHPIELLKIEYIYEWLLLAAHIVGAWLLLKQVPTRPSRWFFVVQAILFPVAFPALPFWRSLVAKVITAHMTVEDFVDIPFIWAVAHPVWVMASLIIAFAYRGPGLGLARMWTAFAQAVRTGTHTFVKAMR